MFFSNFFWVRLRDLAKWQDRLRQYIPCVIGGAGYPLLRLEWNMQFGPDHFWGDIAVSTTLYVLLCAFGSRPLRSYRRALASSLAGSASLTIVGCAAALIQKPQSIEAKPFLFLCACAITFVGTAAIGYAILALAVLCHNWLRPLKLPGHCVACQYDLRGLPEARCPECGLPFDRVSTRQFDQEMLCEYGKETSCS